MNLPAMTLTNICEWLFGNTPIGKMETSESIKVLISLLSLGSTELKIIYFLDLPSGLTWTLKEIKLKQVMPPLENLGAFH